MAIVDELIAILGFKVEGEENVTKFKASLKSVEQRAAAVGKAIGAVAGVAIGAGMAGLSYFGKTALNTSAQFEVFQTTLETIEGSSEKAKQSLNWIAEFGKTTPYDVEQATAAFIKLKAYGIDPIANNTLRTLGDTASAMGKGLDQAVEALADAATGEFERLKEFGIKAKQKGEQVTFTWTQNGQEMSKTVKKTSTDIREFLLETMGSRFGGAMEKQSKTWTGMISNFGDTWTDFQRRVGDAGFFESAKSKLQKLMDAIDRLDKEGKIDQWASNISTALVGMLDVTDKVFTRLAYNVRFLMDNFDTLRPYVIALGTAFGILVARMFPLTTFMLLLALAVDDWITYMQGGESVIGDFIQWLKDLLGIGDTTAKFFAGLAGTILTALTAAFVFAPTQTIGFLIKFLLKSLLGIGRLVWMALSTLGPLALRALASMGGMLLRGLLALGPLLLRGVLALGPLLLKGLTAIFGLLSNPIGWAILIAAIVGFLVWYFWDELKAGWNWLCANVPQLLQQFSDWFTNYDWAGLGKSIMSSMWEGMKWIGAQIKNWFASLVPNWARKFVGLDGDDPQAIAQAANVPEPTLEPTQKAIADGQLSGSAAEQYRKDYDEAHAPIKFDPEAEAKKLELQKQEWEAMQSRLGANLQKMNAGTATEAVTNDYRQDNRESTQNNNITVNQTVTQAVDAPLAAAQSVGAAVEKSVAAQRTQITQEPSF